MKQTRMAPCPRCRADVTVTDFGKCKICGRAIAEPIVHDYGAEMTSIERRFTPDSTRGRVYDDVFETYVGLYPALASVLERPRAGRAPSAGVAA